MTQDRSPVIVDLNLSQALEETEGRSCAAFVDARVRFTPDCGARWTRIAGTYVMDDGPDSPLTQTFGLGVFEEIGEPELDQIEAFYKERNAPLFHEVSPLAPPTLLSLLHSRGYHPVELTNVMTMRLSPPERLPSAPNADLVTRPVPPDRVEEWADVSVQGWSSEVEFADLLRELGLLVVRRAPELAFWVEQDGRPIATGAMFIQGTVALLAGASTIPSARKQGAQRALLAERLRVAVAQGCEMAMMCALPGSPSQRNAQRQGFEIAYTRIKWGK